MEAEIVPGTLVFRSVLFFWVFFPPDRKGGCSALVGIERSDLYRHHAGMGSTSCAKEISFPGDLGVGGNQKSREF